MGTLSSVLTLLGAPVGTLSSVLIWWGAPVGTLSSVLTWWGAAPRGTTTGFICKMNNTDMNIETGFVNLRFLRHSISI